MIKNIRIQNFKSLLDFEIELAKFTCLVGLNGCGKSTVLQSMDFIAQLVRGDITGWLKKRQWDSGDLNSKLSNKLNIDFDVTVELQSVGTLKWSGSFNRIKLNCTSEQISLNDKPLLRVEAGQYTLHESSGNQRADRTKIVFDYEGSILSTLKESQLPRAIHDLKIAMSKIHSLDLLSPELLRSRNREADGQLGLGGERLSAFIHESGPELKKALLQRLRSVYPQLDTIETSALKSGWKQLDVLEHFKGQLIKTSARHMNDGMLRLMAIFSQLQSDPQFLLFDEIENGINPELIEFLVDQLVTSKHQVMVTTHSPVIINYMDDQTAREGLIYLYKTPEGSTQSVRLFDVPSLAKKLEFMGPGEAFVDTNLLELYDEIASLKNLN